MQECFYPYLSNLFADLLMRSTAIDYGVLDKVTFLEYTCLPGIINDRLFSIFAENLDDIKSS